MDGLNTSDGEKERTKKKKKKNRALGGEKGGTFEIQDKKSGVSNTGVKK